jgi:hypothetical protein
LWRPPDLQLALNWQKKQRPTREWAQRYDEAFERAIVFLDTSRITYEAELKNQEMLQKRVLQRTRATAIILGIAAVIAILFFVFAYIQKIAADEQSTIAEKAKVEAIEQSKLAVANELKATQQADIAKKNRDDAVQANRKLESALIEAQAAKEATEDALKAAKYQQTIAEKQTEFANVALHNFGVEYERAEQNYKNANRLYMLAIAQNLATKSEQEDDENLAGLMAMQGYHFHRRFEGKKYDPYIYGGLYSALKKLYGSSYNGMKTGGSPHNHIKSLLVSGKTNTFFASGADGRIFQGDYTKLTLTPSDYSTPYPSKVIAMSSDEKYLVNGSDSSFVQIYDLTAGGKQKPRVIRGFKGSSNDIEFLPNKPEFILATGGKALTIINAETGDVRELVRLPYEVKSLSISPDGKLLAAGTWTGQVLLFNLENNSISLLFNERSIRILSVKFNRAGTALAYGTDDLINKRGFVRLYNLKTNETRQFTGHRAGVYDVEFSPDGKLLASAGSDKRLQLWVLENPEDLPVVMDNNNGFVWDISFTSESDYLIAACSESEIRVWPTDPTLLAQLVCPKLNRNMSQDEWKKYVGDKIDYETTCVVGGLIKDY